MTWGTLCCVLFLFSLNAVLIQVINVYGHITIIFIAIPIIAGMVRNLWLKRVNTLIIESLSHLKVEQEVLNQLFMFNRMVKDFLLTGKQTVELTGLVNVIILECEDPDCLCRHSGELYDIKSGLFSFETPKTVLFKNPIYLRFLVGKLFRNALARFPNSPQLHIAYSQYLFGTIKNIHLAIIELSNAKKKKPNFQQELCIFRFTIAIQEYLKIECHQNKEIYRNLTSVIEFESVAEQCQKSIEKICALQMEFWTQLYNQLPDLNVLQDLSKKISLCVNEIEEQWSLLCKINKSHSKVLNMYGNYLNEIRHDFQRGTELLEKARINSHKKSLKEMIKSADILFADDTVVIHMSGNKENSCRIIKTNQGLTKIFGYSKTEAIGHYVKILMPAIFGVRHSEFVEKYFKAGYKILNEEQTLFGLHRNGLCFRIKLLVKQQPDLNEGIQYVGMIHPSNGSSEYIITDCRGVIDSFSSGVSTILSVPASLFKDNEINIQILAPELLSTFSNPKDQKLGKKYLEPGGAHLTLFLPNELMQNYQNVQKKSVKENDKRSPLPKSRVPLYKEVNRDINRHKGVSSTSMTPKKLLQSIEYLNCENKQKVNCEIQDVVYGKKYETIEPLKMRIFKISGLKLQNKSEDSDSSEDNKGMMKMVSGSYENRELPLSVLKQPSRNNIRIVLEEEKKLVENTNIQPERKEETKTTEPIAGNAITTESRMETKEIGPNFELPKVSFKKSLSNQELHEWKEESSSQSSIETPKINLNSFRNPAFELSSVEEEKAVPLVSKEKETLSGIENQKQSPKHSEPAEKIEVQNPQTLYHMSDNRNSPNEEVKKLERVSSSPPSQLPIIQAIEENEKHIRSDVIKMLENVIQEEDKGEPNPEEKQGLIISEIKQNSSKNSLLEKDEKSSSSYMEKEKTPKYLQFGETNKILPYQVNEDRQIEIEIFQHYIPSNEERKVRERLIKGSKTFMNKDIKKEEPEKIPLKNEEEEELEEEEEKNEEEEEEEEVEQKQEKNEQNADTTSSVASAVRDGTMRAFYFLRASIDEKFVPSSVRNLNIISAIIFFALVILSSVFYGMQHSLYSDILKNVGNIYYSDQRMYYLIDPNLDLMTFFEYTKDENLYLANPNAASSEYYHSINQSTRLQKYQNCQNTLYYKASVLKKLQRQLSKQASDLSSDLIDKVNPENVQLQYKDANNNIKIYTYTISQSIVELVLSTQRIIKMNIGSVDPNTDPVTYFIMTNSLNSILVSLDHSTKDILEETYELCNNNMKIFLIIFIVSSISIVISTAIMLTSLRSIKYKKSEVFELFMNIKKSDVNKQLVIYRKLMGGFQAQQESELITPEQEEENGEDIYKKSWNQEIVEGTRRRKFKRLSLTMGFLFAKFLIGILIMEGYFIMIYFFSSTFLDQVTSLSEELHLLTSRLSEHSLILVIQRLSLISNYTTQFEYTKAEEYITNFHKSTYQSEEDLLDIFLENDNFHSSDYNAKFNTIFYSNLCEHVPSLSSGIATCEAYEEGILTKGLYSSVIKYWDFIWNINLDFLSSSRTAASILKFSQDEDIVSYENLNHVYFNQSLNYLVDYLIEDIGVYFDSELFLDLLLFIIYFIYLIGLYLLFWRVFLVGIQQELWNTKSILSILPPNLMMGISEIKEFIQANSSNQLTQTENTDLYSASK